MPTGLCLFTFGDRAVRLVRRVTVLVGSVVLVAVLLEPQSDDGLTTWNFLDSVLDPTMKQLDPDGHNYPILRITQSITAPTRILP